MGNILLTNYCNRRCPYCFAQQRVVHGGGQAISAENLGKALEFLKRSSLTSVGLLGGEPTLHPDFPEVLDRVLSYGFHVKLFTNGMMPDPAVERLAKEEPGRVLTIVNVNHPDETPESEREHVAATLEVLGKRASLGFNIYRPDFDAAFLIDLVERYGLAPHIRIGLAQPILGGQNAYVQREEYPVVGHRLARFAERTGPKGINVGLDCGFTLCMFAPEDIGPMMYNGVTFKLLCSPVIDIGVDLSVWCCFPLSQWETTHLDQFENRQQAVQYYERKLEPFRAVGATKDCLECRHKAALNCRGGCAAQAIASFRQG